MKRRTRTSRFGNNVIRRRGAPVTRASTGTRRSLIWLRDPDGDMVATMLDGTQYRIYRHGPMHVVSVKKPGMRTRDLSNGTFRHVRAVADNHAAHGDRARTRHGDRKMGHFLVVVYTPYARAIIGSHKTKTAAMLQARERRAYYKRLGKRDSAFRGRNIQVVVEPYKPR